MKRVAVVGGGAAAVLVVVHLARRLSPEADVEVVLFDDSGRVARGVAYSTQDSRHLLNVPAGRMSAVADDDKHFLRWLSRTEPHASAEDYRSRCQYGDYLAQCLAKHARACRLVVRHARVTDIAPTGSQWWVGHERGADVVDAVVLALGHSPPKAVPAVGRAGAEHVIDPWAPGALGRLLDRTSPGDVVVTVGTGLTAVDVALSLVPAGRRVVAVSRSGLLPAAQRPVLPAAVPPVVPSEHEPLTLARLESLVRGHVRDVVAAGGDWRAAIDGFRPVTAELWRRLSTGDRAAFLAGPARRWETVRHRMAPAVAEMIDAYRADGRLDVRRVDEGALTGITPAAVVNCTGPTCDIERYAGGFGQRLVDRGLVRRDKLGLGIETTEDGFVLDAHAEPIDTIAAVGALRRGSLYESTAIPELRAQAAAVADRLVSEPVVTPGRYLALGP